MFLNRYVITFTIIRNNNSNNYNNSISHFTTLFHVTRSMFVHQPSDRDVHTKWWRHHFSVIPHNRSLGLPYEGNWPKIIHRLRNQKIHCRFHKGASLKCIWGKPALSNVALYSFSQTIALGFRPEFRVPSSFHRPCCRSFFSPTLTGMSEEIFSQQMSL
jgi:hypothetical protein